MADQGPDTFPAAKLGLKPSDLRLSLVDPQLVNIDRQHYQRRLDEGKVHDIVHGKRKDVKKHVGLCAERADGSLWAVDGQHHITAAVVLDLLAVPVYKFLSAGWQQEKDVYERLTDLKLGPVQKSAATSGVPIMPDIPRGGLWDSFRAPAADAPIALGPMMKSDDERRYTLGVAFPANKAEIKKAADGKRDVIGVDAIEDTAWRWMAKSREIGLFHIDGMGGHGTPVESYIYRGPDWSIVAVDGTTQVIKSGDWLVGVIWDEPAWALIKSGRLRKPGLSPQGTAVRRKASPELEALSSARS